MGHLERWCVVAIGDVFGIKLRMTYNGQQCRPGFYLVEGSGGASPDPVVNVIGAVLVALGATPMVGFSDHCTLDGVEASDIQPGLLRTQFASGGVETGTVAEDNPLPPQSCGLIQWQTNVKPIKGAFAADGRMFMPGLPASEQIGGFLTLDGVNAISAFASLIFDSFSDDGTAYQLHAVSFTPGSNPRTIRAINPITHFTVDNIVRSQRRREVGRGI